MKRVASNGPFLYPAAEPLRTVKLEYMDYQYSLQDMIGLLGYKDVTPADLHLRLQARDFEVPEGRDWRIINGICTGVIDNEWEDITPEHQIKRLFDVLDIWPTYSAATNIHELYVVTVQHDTSLSGWLWARLLTYLTPEDSPQRKAIEYVLWVDFLEDLPSNEKAWFGLLDANPNKYALERLLTLSGPVPYHMKKPLYERLFQQPENHGILAEAIAHSVQDYFGSIDRKDARRYVSELQLPASNKFIKFLRTAL